MVPLALDTLEGHVFTASSSVITVKARVSRGEVGASTLGTLRSLCLAVLGGVSEGRAPLAVDGRFPLSVGGGGVIFIYIARKQARYKLSQDALWNIQRYTKTHETQSK